MTRRKSNDRLRAFFANLGPGLITGAADDDPSGISTYSVTGASFGYTMLWTTVFLLPLMAAVQLMCARLGMVSGRGLAGTVRRHYPAWVLWSACGLLIIANTINIGADLHGMAAATEMISGVNAWFWIPIYAGVIVLLLFWTSYRHLARILKWLTLVLFAYVLSAFLAKPHWASVIRDTFIPHVEWTTQYLAVLVGVMGTTISPYLFFWQASEEVEEERAMGRTKVGQRKGATLEELQKARVDILTGMTFSNLVMYFISLTTAATLHEHGVKTIESAEQAAEALKPFAGNAAYALFTFGLIGTGMLAIPVLAGSCAYAVAEARAWNRQSLEARPHEARRFYTVIGAAILIGLALGYTRINAITMLFWTAVINGVLAPPLIVLVILLTNNPHVMGEHTNPPWLRVLGWTTVSVMAFAAVAMLATAL